MNWVTEDDYKKYRVFTFLRNYLMLVMQFWLGQSLLRFLGWNRYVWRLSWTESVCSWIFYIGVVVLFVEAEFVGLTSLNMSKFAFHHTMVVTVDSIMTQLPHVRFELWPSVFSAFSSLILCCFKCWMAGWKFRQRCRRLWNLYGVQAFHFVSGRTNLPSLSPDISGVFEHSS